MVPPITDVRPWILGFNHFVFYSFAGYLVRIVAVCGSGVEEFCNDMIDIKRVGNGQRFPVLEDIAPIALIGYNRIALFVLHTNIEQVPRPRRVTVTATESQGQVFVVFAEFLRIVSIRCLRRIIQIVAAAHGVKQHIGKMSCIVMLISRLLDTVVLCHDAPQCVGGLLHGRFDMTDSIGLRNKTHEFMYRYGILRHIADVVPSERMSE